jgi:hypothetical protein
MGSSPLPAVRSTGRRPTRSCIGSITSKREIGAHLYGRRLYEDMAPWQTAEQNPSATEPELEFAGIWRQMPKIVFSRTLEKVEGNARLVREGAVEDRPGAPRDTDVWLSRRLRSLPGRLRPLLVPLRGTGGRMGASAIPSGLLRDCDRAGPFSRMVRPFTSGTPRKDPSCASLQPRSPATSKH